MQFPEHGNHHDERKTLYFIDRYTLVKMLKLLLMAKMKPVLTLPEAF
jgi:hypothetical protein